AAIVLVLTWILVVGVKRSSRFNLLLVVTKLAALVFFIAVGIHFFDARNWFQPDAPSAWRSFAPNGWRGIATGAAIVFFAYIGFDAVPTAAEEPRAPPRHLPDRHSRITRHLHAALCRCGSGPHRHGPVARARHGGTVGNRSLGEGTHLGVHARRL